MRVLAAGAAAGAPRRHGPWRGYSTYFFEQTQPIPTYIFGFWIGAFKRIEACTSSGMVVAANIPEYEDIQHARYGLDFACKAYEFLKGTFGLDLPIKQLELICLPQTHGIGMENFGTPTFLSDFFLVTSKTPLSTRMRIKRLICHEIIHQWHGNMLTPLSFDELWLKEGMARLFEFETVQAIDGLVCGLSSQTYRQQQHKEATHQETVFSTELDFINQVTFQSMVADAQPTAHPIFQQHRGNTTSIQDSFDVLTYGKGACILKMLASFLGRGNFKAAIQKFTLKFQNSSVSGSDLWLTIQDVCEPEFSVSELMIGWLERPCFPLISVRLEEGGSNLILTQFPFFPLQERLDGTVPCWCIPVQMLVEFDDGTFVEINTVMYDRNLTINLDLLVDKHLQQNECLPTHGLDSSSSHHDGGRARVGSWAAGLGLNLELWSGRQHRTKQQRRVKSFIPNRDGAGYYCVAIDSDELWSACLGALPSPPSKASADTSYNATTPPVSREQHPSCCAASRPPPGASRSGGVEKAARAANAAEAAALVHGLLLGVHRSALGGAASPPGAHAAAAAAAAARLRQAAAALLAPPRRRPPPARPPGAVAAAAAAAWAPVAEDDARPAAAGFPCRRRRRRGALLAAAAGPPSGEGGAAAAAAAAWPPHPVGVLARQFAWELELGQVRGALQAAREVAQGEAPLGLMLCSRHCESGDAAGSEGPCLSCSFLLEEKVLTRLRSLEAEICTFIRQTEEGKEQMNRDRRREEKQGSRIFPAVSVVLPPTQQFQEEQQAWTSHPDSESEDYQATDQLLKEIYLLHSKTLSLLLGNGQQKRGNSAGATAENVSARELAPQLHDHGELLVVVGEGRQQKQQQQVVGSNPALEQQQQPSLPPRSCCHPSLLTTRSLCPTKPHYPTTVATAVPLKVK